MSGMLQDVHQKQLESWIGRGPKKFKLLYSISHNRGYDAKTFHRKCDNQGPTVTVVYKLPNSIFGGYTSASWNQSNGYIKDDKAFLFQLQSNGINQYNKFPVKVPDEAIHCHSNYGPKFGHDLFCFKDNGSDSGGHFKLNGTMAINHSYDRKGLSVSEFHDGHMNVSNLEVYKVEDVDRQESSKDGALESPWRESLPWNEQSLKQLTETLQNYGPPASDELKLSETRILMLGPTGAGKSGFFNTINSIFKNRIAQGVFTGTADNRHVNVYCQYRILPSTTQKNLRFLICETQGMEEKENLNLIDFNYLLEGNIPDRYKFDVASPIRPENSSFSHNPGIQDKIHCVMFIFDSSTVDNIPRKILDRINEMQQLLIQKEIPQTVILTKVDKISAIVKADVSKVYHCETVKAVMHKVSDTLGIPLSFIFPIKSYEHETELHQNINILALHALRQVLGFANDFLENYLTQIRSEKLSQMTVKEQQNTSTEK